MRHATALLLVALVASSAAGGPAEVAAALVDVQKLPPEARLFVRYFDLSGVRDKERQDFLRAFVFWVNSLSRNAELYAPVGVAPNLMRIDLRDPGWSVEVWEKLAGNEPYFHVPVKEVEVKEIEKFVEIDHPGGDMKGPDGRVYPNRERGRYKVYFYEKVVTKATGKTAVVSAPWLDPALTASLILATGSQVPIVRADWFLVQTARQLDRNEEKTGAGYYDFLQIKSRNDILKLTGLDEEVSKRIQREIAAIVQDSGVAINSRGIIRKGAQAGGVWFTLDVAGTKGDKNPLRVLNGDFKHEAEEVYFTLPNRLFGLAAVNAADGTLQDFVPEKFASDSQSTNRDARVHPGLSCVRCHVEGLRPIKDWAREFYSGDVLLSSPDYARYKRLKSLYLTPLEDDYEADQLVYAKALLRTTGLTPQGTAKVFSNAWSAYVDRKLTGEDFARELCVTPEQMKEAFAAASKANGGQLDPILLGYLKKPEFVARREHVEEAWPLAQAALNYLKPSSKGPP